jgi:hypothetical protein
MKPMHPPRRIDLFMIVTPWDACMAKHTVPSYDTIAARHPGLQLVIYANGLSSADKARLFPDWTARAHVRIHDNTAEGDHALPRRGDIMVTTAGLRIPLDGGCEHHDEVWTRELPRLTADYVATCDADFEVLDAGFFDEMVRRLDANPSLAGVATDYSPTKADHWESYSQRSITLHERWHTWCCLYRREALQAGHAHYFHSEDEEGTMHCYDSAALMQHRLIRSGWQFECLPDDLQADFIHYGAFSKNVSLSERNLRGFCRLSTLRKVGFRRVGRSRNPLLMGVNWFVRKASGRMFGVLYSGAQAERLPSRPPEPGGPPLSP